MLPGAPRTTAIAIAIPLIFMLTSNFSSPLDTQAKATSRRSRGPYW
jgi:hypothetical protein